ncbi:hypothetical protein V6N11_033523 [Hibiscus sabdariffa]|uniref:DUF4283 domain-containing protein n=1 Tax=Hibiscus sabdariffa TaxID=183260 RepID=A0ABR2PYA9_9ROSI
MMILQMAEALLTDLLNEIDECIDDDDIEFEEGEVVRNTIDGLISIDFSDRILFLAEKSLDQTVIVKLLGRRLGYTTLRNKIYELWKPSQPIKLMDIENDYFLVTFRSRPDYLKALSNGPWTIFGHYLTVDPWTADFSATVPFPTKVVCGRYGHLLENCPDFESELQHEEPMEALVIPEKVKPASPFGPWMVVERRQRRFPKQPVANPGKSDGVVFHASRFNPIHDLDQVDPSGKGVESFPQPQSQSVVKTALSKAKLKSKISHKPSLKSANAVHVRKPLSVTLADFPVLSRNHNKASTSRLASKTTPTVNLDTSKHSTVVMDENSDPNVHHFVRSLDDPTNNNFSHIAGDSSTRPLGDPPDNFINSVVQPEGPDALGKIGNNSGTDPTEGLSHALGSEQSMAML